MIHDRLPCLALFVCVALCCRIVWFAFSCCVLPCFYSHLVSQYFPVVCCLAFPRAAQVTTYKAVDAIPLRESHLYWTGCVIEKEESRVDVSQLCYLPSVHLHAWTSLRSTQVHMNPTDDKWLELEEISKKLKVGLGRLLQFSIVFEAVIT